MIDSSIPSPAYSNCVLYKNIKNICQSSIRVKPIKFISEDANDLSILKINLHETELKNKHITSIKLKFSSLDNKQIFTQEYIDSNLINVKYNVMCGPNVIFDDDFHQDTILLPSGLILPLKCIKDHHSICINMMNISNILSFVNDLELQILYDEVEFEDEFDGLMSTLQIDQFIQTKTNTYNVFRVMFGMGIKAIDIDLPKDKFNEIADKINYRII